MSEEEIKYDPKKEIEKISKKHKIYLTDPSEAEALEIAGFLPLVHKELLSFLEQEKKDGFYILYVTDPNHKEHKYPCKIKYEGSEKVIEEKEEENFLYMDDKGKIKVSISKIVSHLLFNYNFKTIFNTKDETIFVYEEGIYKKKGKEKIKTQVEELLQAKSTTNIVNEIVEKIKRKTAIDKDEFDKTPEEIICLENCFFDLKKMEKFSENDSKFYFKTKLPIKYNPKADCPKIKQFFEEIFYPEDIPTIQEWFGFNLYKRYFIKKAIILFGQKNTGKTVFLNLLMNFIGQKNTTGISLQRISSGDKFALSSLKNKYSNIYDDLSSKDLSDSGGFKIATGGGYITAEYKFGDSFQFLNYAKHIFSTNKIPNVKDVDDDAYYERWIPIPLDNQIKKGEQDKFLLEKLTTEKELSGLLNWAIEGLDRLIKKGKFSFNKTSEEIKIIMERQNNPLIAFVNDVLEQKNGNKISKEIMYRVYTGYCNKNKLPRMSKSQLGRNLEKYSDYIIAKHSSKERYWENVKIKGEYTNMYDTYDTSFLTIRDNKKSII